MKRTAVLLLLLSIPSLAQAQSDTLSGKYPPLGQLVDVGGWHLHLNYTGRQHSGPTVILEAGSGDFSFDWLLVQQQVESFAGVCSYDRAGNAWSQLGPKPRTFKQIAYELHTALYKANIPGPYILVGQSIGGLMVRTYAAMYPQDVAGMVLVDPTHEDTQLSVNGQVRRIRLTSASRTLPPIQTTIRPADQTLDATKRQQIVEFIKKYSPPAISPPYDQLPTPIQQIRLRALVQPSHYVADDDPYWGEEFAELFEARKRQPHPLGNMPLVVIGAGRSEEPANLSSRQKQEWQQLSAEKKRQKADLATLSRNGKFILDEKSGHQVHLEDPNQVIASIREVFNTLRK